MDTNSDNPSFTIDTPAKKQRGALLVHERLRNEILWMEIPPGSALDEVALARRYNLSRTPVREALLLLANEGFVQFLPNRTTVVSNLTMHNVPAAFDALILLARGIIRPAASRGVAISSVLQDFIDRYATYLAAGEAKAAFKEQLLFFRYLGASAESKFLERYFVEALDMGIRLKQLYFFPDLDATQIERAVGLLQTVKDCVCAHDPDASDAAIVRSILFESEIILQNLGPRFAHEMPIDTNPNQEDATE